MAVFNYRIIIVIIAIIINAGVRSDSYPEHSTLLLLPKMLLDLSIHQSPEIENVLLSPGYIKKDVENYLDVKYSIYLQNNLLQNDNFSSDIWNSQYPKDSIDIITLLMSTNIRLGENEAIRTYMEFADGTNRGIYNPNTGIGGLPDEDYDATTAMVINWHSLPESNHYHNARMEYRMEYPTISS